MPASLRHSVLTLALLLAACAIRAQAQAAGPPALDMSSLAGRAAGQPAPASPASFAYVPTAALKQQTLRRYAERLQATDPAAAQAAPATYGPGKNAYDTLYGSLLAGTGLRDNDAADALAALLLLGYQVVHNLRNPNLVSLEMARGLRGQVAAVLAHTPQLNRAAVGEECKLQTVVLSREWDAAVKNKTRPAYQRQVAALFQTQYHLVLSQVKLTSQGFVKE